MTKSNGLSALFFKGNFEEINTLLILKYPTVLENKKFGKHRLQKKMRHIQIQ